MESEELRIENALNTDCKQKQKHSLLKTHNS